MKNWLGVLLAALAAVPMATTFHRDRGDAGGAAEDGLGAVLSLGSQASHPWVLGDGPQDVYLYLSLRGAELPAVPRLGMNLALVIDRSGSMASDNKLRFAKSAAEQLVGRLRPDDQLAIVAYDTDVRLVVPSTPAAQQERFLEAIRALETGSSTNLHGGLVSGYAEVSEHFDEARLNRVLLLSDGLANVGVTDPSVIEEQARQWRERGVRISTMGMGLAYDEALMSGIAHHAGGNYYYVDHAEAVGRYLDRELDELTRVVARDVEVRVVLGEGVALQEVFGYSSRIEGTTVVVPVSDMYSGERSKVVMRLRVQGQSGTMRQLATAALRYRNALTREPRAEEAPPLDVHFTDSPEQVESARSLDVLVKVEVVRNALALDAAMKLQKDGALDAAQELLAARYLNSRTLNDAEYRSDELARMLSKMKQVLLDLERTRGDVLAGRDLQLATGLEALGYLGAD